MESRLLPCNKCGRKVVIRSKGLCPLCRSKELPKKEKKQIKIKKKMKSNNYSSFYNKHLKLITISGVKSMESGKDLFPVSVHNVCHIFPKRIYSSIAENDLNIVYLTADEHSRFDFLLDRLELDRLEAEFPRTTRVIKKKLPLFFWRIEENGKLKDKIEELGWIM